MKLLKTLRVTLPLALAAFTLAVTGSLSTASATTYWSFRNGHMDACLVTSPSTDSVWWDTCNDSLATRNYYYGQEAYDADGHTMRRLVSRANGDCLTTALGSNTNAVWMALCGSDPNQFWTNDGNYLSSDWLEVPPPGGGGLKTHFVYLRTSDNGKNVYTTPDIGQPGIDIAQWKWYGAHS
ncbi:hypothetical protein ABZ883_41475 [Streptomyces sp. NPDC046977]|uniref:hypothetical protein n=1 Tax=Streptomyces sp. NPDC046977 TaxID=3154703 RepID=UPI0033E42EB6